MPHDDPEYAEHSPGSASSAGDAKAGQAGEPAAPPLPGTLEEALAQIIELRGALTTREAEVGEWKDCLLHERAELENFKKRMQREKAEALRFASEPLLRELLPIVDNLHRAIQAADAAGVAKVLADGVRLVATGFQDTVGRFGVTRIQALGEPFDPARHEALAQTETADAPPGTVVEELAAGWLLHDRLLRPAQVVVARGTGT